MRTCKNKNRLKKRGGFPVVGTIVLSSLIAGVSFTAYKTFFEDMNNILTKQNTFKPAYN